MTTKRAIKATAKFLLADDVRHETSGRFSLMGVFPGERFLVAGPLPVGGHGMPGVAFIVPSLVFVFIVTGVEGQKPGNLSVVAPDGKTKVADVQLLPSATVNKDAPFVIFSFVRPFGGPSFGEYSVKLELDGNRWSFPLVIEQGPDGAISPPALPKPRRKKTS